MSASAGPTDIQELARSAMLPIGRKLQGLSREGRVTSVSNQVEALIREATDPVRLVSQFLIVRVSCIRITSTTGKDVCWMDGLGLRPGHEFSVYHW